MYDVSLYVYGCCTVLWVLLTFMFTTLYCTVLYCKVVFVKINVIQLGYRSCPVGLFLQA